MVQAVSKRVRVTRERLEGKRSHPLIDIDNILDVLLKGSHGKAEHLAERDRLAVIIEFCIVFLEEWPTVVLLVCTAVLDIDIDDLVGLRKFRSLRIARSGRGRVIDQFQFIAIAISAVA